MEWIFVNPIRTALYKYGLLSVIHIKTAFHTQVWDDVLDGNMGIIKQFEPGNAIKLCIGKLSDCKIRYTTCKG